MSGGVEMAANWGHVPMDVTRGMTNAEVRRLQLIAVSICHQQGFSVEEIRDVLDAIGLMEFA